MLTKIITTILLLTAVFMGVKQGYAMIAGRPAMLDLFSKWHFSKTAVQINGVVTLLSSLLVLHPKTFLWGNFLMAAGIFLIICFHAQDRDLKGILIELPFMLLNLVLIYLHHPLTNTD